MQHRPSTPLLLCLALALASPAVPGQELARGTSGAPSREPLLGDARCVRSLQDRNAPGQCIGASSAATFGLLFRASSHGAVPGGRDNEATGSHSFAAGRRAKASHDGAFVWGDHGSADKASSADDQFNVYASGGVRMFTNSAATTGVLLAPGAGSWSSVSDRDAKENLRSVDPRTVLEQVAGLTISTWNYKEQDDAIRHMGPMAQDFHEAFGLGVSDQLIDTVDSDGVALAAIQALDARDEELAAKLEASLAAKDAELAALRAELRALAARTDELARRATPAPYGPNPEGGPTPEGEVRRSVDALLARSLEHYGSGEFRECIAACEEALVLDPASALAHNNIGASWINLGEPERAIAACERALELDPALELARNNLAWARDEIR